MYKLIFKDPDCVQLAPNTKIAIRTYINDRINIVGTCSLFVVHPDSNKLKQITFYVTSHEGSVVLSCKAGLNLNLIHPHSNLDQIPDCDNLICSNADCPMKEKSKKSAQKKYINHCVSQENKSSKSKWEYKADVHIEDDKNCQINRRPLKSKMYADKKCQAETFDIQPMKPQMDIWLPKPALRRLCKDKNCQSTRCYSSKKKSPVRPMYNYDKNCQPE